MKILTFVKQILDSEAKISLKEDKRSLNFEERFSLNFFDEFAIEEAVRIKEKISNCEVVAISLGSKKAQEVLRTAIAMGADKAVLIETERYEILDPSYTAKVLSAFAQREGFHMIICGERAMDDENGVTGALVGGYLKIPYVGSVVRLEIEGEGKAVAESEINGSFCLYEVTLPAVFSVRKGINEPRVPSVTGVMKAMKMKIPVLEVSSLSPPTSKTQIESYDFPEKRPQVKIIEGATPEEKVKKLITLLREEAKVI